MSKSPSIDSKRYDHNLAALRERQPEVAACIENATGPKATLVEGRDGTLTFLIATDEGNRWLGGSSMPTVTAEELFRAFAGGHESIIVPGIMTGKEIQHLAARFSRHAAIFIVEESAFHLQLALRVDDYRALIERGQVVFLLEADFESQLLSLFRRYPGYAMPTRMLSIPHNSTAAHADLQRRIEHAGSKVAQHHSAMLSRLRADIASAHHDADMTWTRTALRSHGAEKHSRASVPRPPSNHTPSLAVLSTDASELTSRDADRVARALDHLGWRREECIPDRPDKCHGVARLQAIADGRADAVIFVNSAAGSLRALLPSTLPVISWFFASARIPSAIESMAGSSDLFVASSAAQQTQLVAAGAPEERVHYAGIVADSEYGKSAQADAETGSAPGAEAEFDVVLFGDVPDDRPEAAGVNLSTHATLWRKTAEIAAARATQSKPLSAAELLSAAEERCDVKLREAKVRGDLVRKVEERVLPAAFARVLARELLSRCNVLLAGANWDSVWREQQSASSDPNTPSENRMRRTTDPSRRRGIEKNRQWIRTVPTGEELLALVRRAQWAVLPFFSTTTVQLAVDLLSAGEHVALRAGNTPLAECHPELRDVATMVRTFSNAKQLTEIVRSRPPEASDARLVLEQISLHEALVRALARAQEVSDAHASALA